MTTLAHQGRNNLFLTRAAQEKKLLAANSGFRKSKLSMMSFVSTTHPEFCKHFSDRVTRLELDTTPLLFREKFRKDLHPQRD